MLVLAVSVGHPSSVRAQEIKARVTDVVDGDTIRVRVSETVRTVRLLGIDAPNPGECGSRQAISNLLVLTFTDPLDTDGDHYFDRGGGSGRRVVVAHGYARTAAGVQLQEDQLFRGWARARGGRFSRAKRFRRIEADARAVKHGIWSKCGGDFHKPIR